MNFEDKKALIRDLLNYVTKDMEEDEFRAYKNFLKEKVELMNAILGNLQMTDQLYLSHDLSQFPKLTSTNFKLDAIDWICFLRYELQEILQAEKLKGDPAFQHSSIQVLEAVLGLNRNRGTVKEEQEAKQ